jgi:hypothetical protein
MQYLLGQLSLKTLIYPVLRMCYLKGKHRAWGSRVGATLKNCRSHHQLAPLFNSINPARRHEQRDCHGLIASSWNVGIGWLQECVANANHDGSEKDACGI